jgi:prevent-host-death family protein
MNTHLVTTLKRKATQILSEVKRTKTPVLITQYGQPTAYIVDAESYANLQEKMAILENIARGERAIKENRTITHQAARKLLQKWTS